MMSRQKVINVFIPDEWQVSDRLMMFNFISYLKEIHLLGNKQMVYYSSVYRPYVKDGEVPAWARRQ